MIFQIESKYTVMEILSSQPSENWKQQIGSALRRSVMFMKYFDDLDKLNLKI